MKTDELREAYLSFFESKGCTRKASDVLVPRDDPTVLFTPAGMNQFKREFMGLGDPNFKSAVTCQKCIRTGDIENVGRTAFHETFFEMMGNFSFGDYFKREAIHWAWEFLTKTLAIAPNRLTVTVYLTDDEAFDIWHKEIGLDAGRIERKDEDENFWPASAPSQGPNGVCGPCSEIYYHGNGPKEVEIWNLVFTQYNRVGVNQLEPLPSKNIDTGMGLERAAACLQGAPTVFEIDIFKPIVAVAADLLGTPYIRETPEGVRIRRLADHARALCFTVHENVRPSAEKQGYVIRRLLRRAVLDAYQMGKREPFLYQLAPVVAEAMRVPYPELADSVPKIQAVMKEEEEQFLRNLERGLKRLHDTFQKTRGAGNNVIAAKDAFELHATHGIPVEIVASLAADHDLSVDMSGFETEVAAHGILSGGGKTAAVFETTPLDALKKEYHHGTAFLAYESVRTRAKVIQILAQGHAADSAGVEEGGAPIALVLDKSPFYGESGGQVGDRGTIQGEDFTFDVIDTHKKNDFLLHIGHVRNGEVQLDKTVEAVVDVTRRQAVRRAHSATHVLHHALHKHVGEHAQQAGSLVEPDRLRFDFSNPEAVSRDNLRAIENTVNSLILQADPINYSFMPIEKARQLGAMALFGEKYPETVRVVSMGEFSKELCGGTHLDNVGQIGVCKILREESVASGTRRITALTGQAALDHIRQEEDSLSGIAAVLKVPPTQAAERVALLLEELKTLKKQSAQRKVDTPNRLSPDQILAEAKVLPDHSTTIVARKCEDASIDDLRQLADVLRRKKPEALAVLLASAQDGKVQLVAALTPDLITRGAHAGNWLKVVAPIVGGGGGGRPDLAQAGGKDPARIEDALEQGVQSIIAKLG